jgi:hypothetical protein
VEPDTLTDDRLEQVARHVGFDRRAFVKRVAASSPFAAPVVTSSSMTGVNSVFAAAPMQSVIG